MIWFNSTMVLYYIQPRDFNAILFLRLHSFPSLIKANINCRQHHWPYWQQWINAD